VGWADQREHAEDLEPMFLHATAAQFKRKKAPGSPTRGAQPPAPHVTNVTSSPLTHAKLSSSSSERPLSRPYGAK
jgi:hypothetical protein